MNEDFDVPSVEASASPRESSMAGQASRYVAPPHFPQPGDKVKFLGENGYPIQLKIALGIFKVGQVLTVKDVHIGGWETRLTFWGGEGSHNSVMFERVSDGSPQGQDAQRLDPKDESASDAPNLSSQPKGEE